MVDLSELKICFLAGTLGQGGAERQLFYILKTLRQQGANVRVLSLTEGEFWEEPIRRLGIPLTYVGKSRSRWKRLRRILAELHNDRIDIIQGQHIYTNLYASITGMILGLSDIGAIRSDGIKEIENTGMVMGVLSVKLTRLLAVNSITAMSNLARYGIEKKCVFLPNVVDISRFQPGDLQNAQDSPVRILSVGRLSQVKRFDRLIDWISRFDNCHQKNIELFIAGDGPEKGELQKYAQHLDITFSIDWLGSVSNVIPLYQNADIFVLTSDYEGTPNVILEAMASGLPVVATNVGGVSDIIEDGKTGFLVSPNEQKHFENVMITLIQDVSLRREVGSRARDYVQANHALDRLPFYLSRLYERALQ